jgi:dihydroorotase
MIEKRVIIVRPDDMHLHLRDGAIMDSVVAYTSRDFARSVIMPNLNPPITTVDMARSYKKSILNATPASHNFEPLMTLYLTEETSPDEIKLGVEEGLIKAVKLYPAGATTNSLSGVTNIRKVFAVLDVMSDLKLPLLIHGEVVDESVDIFDREAVFIDKILDPLRDKFQELRIVLEHITTNNGVNYVKNANKNLAATITTHHLALNRNDLFQGGINPHNYCLPILKREEHRQSLIKAATSGNEKFFLGTDSAPHLIDSKESACGCAGIFNAPNTIGVLASIFEEYHALSNLESFTSLNGCKFYGLPPNKTKTVLVKKDLRVDFEKYIDVVENKVKVFEPGFDIYWHIEY